MDKPLQIEQLRAHIAAIEADEPAEDGYAGDSEEESPAQEAQRAFSKIERVARVREQASAALRQRLLREGFSADAVETAIERALACGLVDDARYADVLVRSRLSQGRGRQGIAAELARLGIDADTVEAFREAEELAQPDDELERALALLRRKPPTAKNKREGAYRRLMQKGFDSDTAVRAARRWTEEAAQE